MVTWFDHNAASVRNVMAPLAASRFAWTGGTFRAVAGDTAMTADRQAPRNRGAVVRQPAAPRTGGHLLLKNPTNQSSN